MAQFIRMSQLALGIFICFPNLAFGGVSAMPKEFPPSVIILLAEPLNPKSNSLRIQDFVRETKHYLPAFSSKASYQQSLQGKELNYPLVEIKREMLLSILKGTETIILDVATEGEQVYLGSDLKKQFAEEVAQFNNKMKAQAGEANNSGDSNR